MTDKKRIIKNLSGAFSFSTRKTIIKPPIQVISEAFQTVGEAMKESIEEYEDEERQDKREEKNTSCDARW